MKRILITLVLLMVLFTSKGIAQSFSSSAAYQLGRSGEYYGASISKWIKTFNNQKVIVRGTAALFLGNHWGEKSEISHFQRIEIGVESKNTMIAGRDFFNIINFSYVINKLDVNKTNRIENQTENGWMFSFGLGARILNPFSFTARYIWGPQNGIRLGLEWDI